jgi:asparagine synthase (glutamine-hydrolysing)
VAKIIVLCGIKKQNTRFEIKYRLFKQNHLICKTIFLTYMCGISAIILKTKAHQHLKKNAMIMAEALKHRGPDSEGYMVYTEGNCYPLYGEKTQKNCIQNALPFSAQQSIQDVDLSNSQFILSHKRLSIIDLSPSGHQPMCDHQKQIWITYNGELYNYIELRADLKRLGHTFHTQSDTEVIIEAYKEWGSQCLERLNGMFAFILFDKGKETFLISRDITGVKPLYYYENQDAICFASEQKALLKIVGINKTLDEDSIYKHLLYNFQGSDIDGKENTFFKYIKSIPKSQALSYKLRTNEKQWYRYFDPSPFLNSSQHLNTDDLEDKVFEGIKQSVNKRLRSDVDIAACLSGGLDSSTITAMMHHLKANDGKPLNLFTITFPNQKEDESVYAQAMAKHINGLWHPVQPNAIEFEKDINDLVYSQDTPIVNTSTYAQWRVIKAVKEYGFKVVMNGQGGDELFGGYPIHWLSYWNEIPWLQKIKEQSTPSFFVSPWQFEYKQRLKQALHKTWKKNYSNERHFNTQFINRTILAKEKHCYYYNTLNEHLLNDYFGFTLSNYLKYEDRCGMWHSVESRLPFADDKDLMQLLFNINGKVKLRQSLLKDLLRKSMSHILPELIIRRNDKKGLESPDSHFLPILKKDLKIHPVLTSYLSKKYIDQILKNQNIDASFQVKVLFFNKWLEIFIA